MLRPLPIVLTALPDEVLTSWLDRHAAFYDVPPPIMLRHCLGDDVSRRTANLFLSDQQIANTVRLMNADPDAIRRMTFVAINPGSRRLLAVNPIQFCTTCSSTSNERPASVRRHQLRGWRITCPLCKVPLRSLGGEPGPHFPFERYSELALQGETLLSDEAEFGARTWASPIDIVRLLLMRRNPRGFPPERAANLRILGVVIPELDDELAASTEILPSAGNPILPLHWRPALLAAVVIVVRDGPNLLETLHAYTIGENRNRFTALVRETINRSDARCS